MRPALPQAGVCNIYLRNDHGVCARAFSYRDEQIVPISGMVMRNERVFLNGGAPVGTAHLGIRGYALVVIAGWSNEYHRILIEHFACQAGIRAECEINRPRL